MQYPVGQDRMMLPDSVLQKMSKRKSGAVDGLAIAQKHEHGDIHCKTHILLVARFFFEDLSQESAPVRVGPLPHMHAK